MSIISSVLPELADPGTIQASLGLDDSHRGLAQLIPANQRSACYGDSASVHASADRLVESLVRHLKTERGDHERLGAPPSPPLRRRRRPSDRGTRSPPSGPSPGPTLP